MDGYKKSSHKVYNIKFHVIWMTKYQYKVLRGPIAKRVRELIRQGCEASGITILQGSIGTSSRLKNEFSLNLVRFSLGLSEDFSLEGRL